MNNFNNVMLDCETLATSNDAVILSIAAVCFDPFQIDYNPEDWPTLDILVETDISQVDRHIDPKTVSWWGNQEKRVIDRVFSPDNRLPLSKALDEVTKFTRGKSRLWAQGITFDFGILENAYKSLDKSYPWEYWKLRDSRTILDLVSVDQPPVTHDAAEDVRRQASGVIQALNKLGVKYFIR